MYVRTSIQYLPSGSSAGPTKQTPTANRRGSPRSFRAAHDSNSGTRRAASGVEYEIRERVTAPFRTTTAELVLQDVAPVWARAQASSRKFGSSILSSSGSLF